jgi:transposase InsO family protein
MKLLDIKIEYIQKQTPEYNGDIESFHNSIKTDYIRLSEFRGFHDTPIEKGKSFSDYDECSLHSSIDYITTRELRRKFLDDPEFREKDQKKEI